MNHIATAVIASFALNTATAMNVFIVAGQSNAVGQGNTASLPPQYSLLSNAFIYNEGDGIVPLTPATCLGEGHGVELSFVARMHELAAGPICIVKTAQNGSSMADPNPAGNFGTWSPFGGDLFDRLVDDVQAAIALLEADGHDPVIKGMVWWQGESDAHSSGVAHQQFQARTQVFMDAIRAELQANSMTTCIVRCGTNIGGSWAAQFPHMSTIRAAQEALGAQANSCWIDIDDLYAGDIHPGSASLVTAGIRAANAVYNESFGSTPMITEHGIDREQVPVGNYYLIDTAGRIFKQGSSTLPFGELRRELVTTGAITRSGTYILITRRGSITFGAHIE
jgi:hypothetical protein